MLRDASAAAGWQGTTKGLQYTTQCYEEMGRGLCHSVLLCFTRSKVLMSTVAQLHTQFPAGVTEDAQVAALGPAHCSVAPSQDDLGSDEEPEEEEEVAVAIPPECAAAAAENPDMAEAQRNAAAVSGADAESTEPTNRRRNSAVCQSVPPVKKGKKHKAKGKGPTRSRRNSSGLAVRAKKPRRDAKAKGKEGGRPRALEVFFSGEELRPNSDKEPARPAERPLTSREVGTCRFPELSR